MVINLLVINKSQVLPLSKVQWQEKQVVFTCIHQLTIDCCSFNFQVFSV